uniref:SCP domain-containing protein n=1 Tax=Mesocestoides corti TaxID=53468 RepID=A0A5K3FYF1_MESCO
MLKILCLLAMSVHVFGDVPTANESAELLENLTRIRENVRPQASDMMLLNYSTEMENVANKWVSQCKDEYPFYEDYPEYNETGFILVTSNHSPKFTEAFTNVEKQVSLYKYIKDICIGDCFSYKQAVWASTTKVGCAKKYCQDKNLGIVICAFNNANNHQTGRPYFWAPNCTRCPKDYRCVRNQCAPPLVQPQNDTTTTAIPATTSTTLSSIPTSSSTTPQQNVTTTSSAATTSTTSTTTSSTSISSTAQVTVSSVSSTQQQQQFLTTTSASTTTFAFAILLVAMLLVQSFV